MKDDLTFLSLEMLRYHFETAFDANCLHYAKTLLQVSADNVPTCRLVVTNHNQSRNLLFFS